MRTLSDKIMNPKIKMNKKSMRNFSRQEFKNWELIRYANSSATGILERIQYGLKRMIIRVAPAVYYYNKAEH